MDLYKQLRFLETYVSRIITKKRFNSDARGWIYQSSFCNVTLSIARTSAIRNVYGSLNK